MESHQVMEGLANNGFKSRRLIEKGWAIE